MASTADLLDRFLDPIGKALSPEAARRLIELRADADTQRRVNELADKANEGSLSSDERADYESLVAAGSLIAVLQGKARSVLAGNTAA